jgi:hypothetical protein
VDDDEGGYEDPSRVVTGQATKHFTRRAAKEARMIATAAGPVALPEERVSRQAGGQAGSGVWG